MIRKMNGRGLECAAILAALAGMATGAQAQVFDWANPVPGSWHSAFSWNPQLVPSGPGATGSMTVPGTYTVTMGGSVTVGGVVLGHSGVTLSRTSTGFLTLSSMVNNGLVSVGDGGPGEASVRASSTNVPIVGTGTLRLNALANDGTCFLNERPEGGGTFEQGAGHTLAGAGEVYCPFHNNGTIDADVPGLAIVMRGSAQTNSGVMRATNGGALELNSAAFSGPGVIEAQTGSLVRLHQASITGGSVLASGTGVVRVSAPSVMEALGISAPVVVAEGTTLRLAGVISNTGTITLNESGGEGTTILHTSAGGTTLSGPGMLVLNAGNDLWSALVQWDQDQSETLTQGPNHSIRGTGRITAALINDGLVDANYPGRILEMRSAPKVNNGLMRASLGGTLETIDITLTNPGTIHAAHGSLVHLQTTLVGGGTITSAGSGAVRIGGFTDFDSVTNAAAMGISNLSALRIVGTLNNLNVITVNETAGGDSTQLRSAPGDSLLAGPGTVVLNGLAGPTAAQLYWSVDREEMLTQAAGHTIRGTGQILLRFINNGLVEADQAGMELQLTEEPKTNNGTIRATGGGTLAVLGTTLTNTALLEAADASLVTLHEATLTGGTLAASGSGVVRTSGTSTLASLTTNAPIFTVDGSVLKGVGTIINNGVITINETAGPSQTPFQTTPGGTVLGGTGSLRLNSSQGPGSSLVIWTTDPSESLTQGQGHSIIGTGAISARLINHGTISPGANPGDAGYIDFGSQTCTLSAFSTVRCDINGTQPEDYDRLTGTAVRELDGRLEVIIGISPAPSATFDIITGPYSGRFNALQLPKGYYIEYLADLVRIGFSGCYGDWDQDGDVDSDDILAFFGDFEAGEADFDLDNDTDSDDIIGFFAAFESGC